MGHGKLCATQGALIDVTLDMNLVSTTPHLNHSSCERFETDWTLVVHFTKYFVNKTLKSKHCLTRVANEFSFEIHSVNLHEPSPQYGTEVLGTRHALQGVPMGWKGRESL